MVEKSADVDGAMAGLAGRRSWPMAVLTRAGSTGQIGRTSMMAPKKQEKSISLNCSRSNRVRRWFDKENCHERFLIRYKLVRNSVNLQNPIAVICSPPRWALFCQECLDHRASDDRCWSTISSRVLCFWVCFDCKRPNPATLPQKHGCQRHLANSKIKMLITPLYWCIFPKRGKFWLTTWSNYPIQQTRSL